MSGPAERLVCRGCGAELGLDEPLPFRCPDARPGDDIDHVLRREAGALAAPLELSAGDATFQSLGGCLRSWSLARSRGLAADDVLELVRTLEDRVAEVDGRRLAVTPYRRSEELDLWFKDETDNVAGSHKARHLFGIALHLEVARRTGLLDAAARDLPLAIASCGNAALAAAVVAVALGRRLLVFLPPWAEAGIVGRLTELGAELIVCERDPRDPPGDPCYRRFLGAVAADALPFTCQSDQNALNLDGGSTLGWELALQHRAATSAPLERVFIQVGGGALASATARALAQAWEADRLPRRPTLHPVQTAAAAPLVRAWRTLAGELAEELLRGGAGAAPPTQDAELAAFLHGRLAPGRLASALGAAARQRSRYMRPVADEPRSIATGILDDETYDWLGVLRAMFETGGWPVVVGETLLERARDRARTASGRQVSATGAAGLAGVLAEREAGRLAPGEKIAVLFTGAGP